MIVTLIVTVDALSIAQIRYIVSFISYILAGMIIFDIIRFLILVCITYQNMLMIGSIPLTHPNKKSIPCHAEEAPSTIFY